MFHQISNVSLSRTHTICLNDYAVQPSLKLKLIKSYENFHYMAIDQIRSTTIDPSYKIHSLDETTVMRLIVC